MSDPGLEMGGTEPPLAAEYALGLLDAPERADAERRALSDHEFAREVETWQARLAVLANEVVAQTPPAHVWAAVERRLEDRTGPIELRLRRSVNIWRSATAVAAALAAVLAVTIISPHPPATPAPVLTARLIAHDKGPTVFVAFYDPSRQAIVLTPASVASAPDRSPELWLIPVGGKPIALGVAAFGSSVQLISTAAGQGVGAGTLAVSVEPKGGSITGQPTGPVIATGHLTSL